MKPNDFPAANQSILFEDESWSNFGFFIKQSEVSSIFILVDSNTEVHCLPQLLGVLKAINQEAVVLKVEAGEKSKDLTVCSKLWSELTKHRADRHALLINLGGGMITDLGGFVASIYKRGIDFINIPTSLLGMIDASIGGKCGIDFQHYKNHLGVFKTALSTFIFPNFLSSLPEEELTSGFAEAIKHALIKDATYWKELKNSSKANWKAITIIKQSIQIKTDIVANDPLEKGDRKKLNFGHSLGHALESYFFEKEQPIPHGFAIASGMIMEAYISVKQLGLSQAAFEEILGFIQSHYPLYELSENAVNEIIKNLTQDKKNSGGELRFCLLNNIGIASVDIAVDLELIKESIAHYRQLT
ncbi:MAG: 3-dehydroquinate synthase [Vicingaceae bacterium]